MDKQIVIHLYNGIYSLIEKGLPIQATTWVNLINILSDRNLMRVHTVQFHFYEILEQAKLY